MKFLEIVLTVLVVAKFVGAQRQGDPCTVVKTGQVGSCLHLSKCPVVLEAAYRNISPQICGMADTVAIVCCPRVSVLEGSKCALIDTTPGVCRAFSNCPRAMKAAIRGVVPQKCDLTDNESDLVCCTETDCPPLPKGLVTQLPVGSKAADYCIELAEKIHPCQETRSGWTRGNMCPVLTPDSNIKYHQTPMITAAEAPFFGLIGSGRRGAITWEKFPVTLVSDQWVLCAGFAIGNIGSNKVEFVGLGGTFTPQYKPDEVFGVTEQRIHPQFNPGYSVFYDDIALLRLDRRVTFSSRILPACLHTGTPLPDSGFVQTGQDESASFHFKTTMRIMSQEECSRRFPTGSYGHPAGVKHDREICSSPVNTSGGCGGWYQATPLTLPNSLRVACTHLLVGFKLYYVFPPCAVTNTRISTFVPWIEDIVWP